MKVLSFDADFARREGDIEVTAELNLGTVDVFKPGFRGFKPGFQSFKIANTKSRGGLIGSQV